MVILQVNYTYTDMVNLSLNQTIVRSLNTTGQPCARDS